MRSAVIWFQWVNIRAIYNSIQFLIRIRLNCILLWGYLKWDRACKCFTQKKKFICEVNIRRFALLIYVQCMQRYSIRLFEQIQTNCYNNVNSLETSMAFLHLEKWYTLCNKKYVTKYPYVWSTVCSSSPIE